jgi:hypothetical protein
VRIAAAVDFLVMVQADFRARQRLRLAPAQKDGFAAYAA